MYLQNKIGVLLPISTHQEEKKRNTLLDQVVVGRPFQLANSPLGADRGVLESLDK